MNLSICFIYFFILFILSLIFFVIGLYFVMFDMSFFFEWNIFDLNTSSVVMVIYLDWISLFFTSFVMFISCMVIFYSSSYMGSDLFIVRFIFLVLMFVFSMLLMILSPNLISILLGWDGLGLVSFCLVIYYQNISSMNAGLLTILSNRIGDVMILMSIAWMLNFGSWNFMFYLDCMKDDFSMMFIMYFVFLAGITSSAQIPFSAWLPAAMAAPTPVSSLVHSSTLVTAGVYLLIRFNFCFSNSLNFFLLFVSSMTMFMSGLGANYEFDLSKIIALSTLSQLGLMMMTLSLGKFSFVFFHLLTHAVFKALLFMCAGFLIHNVKGNQDIRNLGGLVFQMPIVCSCMMISSLSLCGMPFLSGFYSSDLIIEMVLMNYLNFYIFLLLMISTGLTVAYSFRLFYYSVVGEYNYCSLFSLGYYDLVMIYSMIPMVFINVIAGSLVSWLIFPFPVLIIMPISLSLSALLVSLIGLWLGYEISKFSLSWSLLFLKCYEVNYFFLLCGFYQEFHLVYLIFYPLKGGGLLLDLFDLGWNESLGGQGLFLFIKVISVIIQNFQMNILKIFFLLFLFVNITFFLYFTF
uniref:NADH-ubiquinone oxidoreductase chain 5 n=1 Tax=Priacma serrata TaxID=50550 RepID=A0A0S2MQR8_PRISE|nr:NADH deshydrogenase subunit 5 [Priacma serrata]